MQTVIICDSKFGNTWKIAEAIAAGVPAGSPVRLVNASDAAAAAQALTGRPDLVFVGGPTHNRGLSAGLKAFVGHWPSSAGGLRVATFDTRYRGPRLVMGSAAAAGAKALARSGAELVGEPESFFIVRQGPVQSQGLEAGELERAAGWAAAVIATVAPDADRRTRAVAG